jgi:hypothetical protein
LAASTVFCKTRRVHHHGLAGDLFRRRPSSRFALVAAVSKDTPSKEGQDQEKHPTMAGSPG